MIPFNNRFHGHSSLNYVYKNGKSFHSRLFKIKVIDNPKRKKTRAAVIISKKVLKSAVRRNRVRRQIYEYISKKIIINNEKIYDIAIIVLSGELFSMNQVDIFDQLDQLFNQTNINNSK